MHHRDIRFTTAFWSRPRLIQRNNTRLCHRTTRWKNGDLLTRPPIRHRRHRRRVTRRGINRQQRPAERTTERKRGYTPNADRKTIQITNRQHHTNTRNHHLLRHLHRLYHLTTNEGTRRRHTSITRRTPNTRLANEVNGDERVTRQLGVADHHLHRLVKDTTTCRRRPASTPEP